MLSYLGLFEQKPESKDPKNKEDLIFDPVVADPIKQPISIRAVLLDQLQELNALEHADVKICTDETANSSVQPASSKKYSAGETVLKAFIATSDSPAVKFPASLNDEPLKTNIGKEPIPNSRPWTDRFWPKLEAQSDAVSKGDGDRGGINFILMVKIYKDALLDKSGYDSDDEGDIFQWTIGAVIQTLCHEICVHAIQFSRLISAFNAKRKDDFKEDEKTLKEIIKDYDKRSLFSGNDQHKAFIDPASPIRKTYEEVRTKFLAATDKSQLAEVKQSFLTREKNDMKNIRI